MIIKKSWRAYQGGVWHNWTGYFLFGIIPLYVVREGYKLE